VAYVHKGDLEQAMLHLQRALDVAMQSGDRRRGILACNDLGGVYWQQGDYGQSITYLQRAAMVADEIDYRQAISWNLTNLASIYGQVGELDYALHCAGQALAVALELGDWPVILLDLGSIAMILQLQKRYEEAEAVHNRVIDLARTLNSPYQLCAFLYAKADLYRLQNRYTESQTLAQEALTVAEEVEERDVLFDTMVLMIHLRLATQQIDRQKAVSELESLLAKWTDDAQQAALHYEIWHVDQAQQTSRMTSANLYRDLYTRKPDMIYRQRYETLTGELLSKSASLPPISRHLHDISVDLVSLLQRAGVQFQVAGSNDSPKQ
jgi:tetratricopeptide (TPR) repeat protein